MKALSTRHRIAGGLGVVALALAACGTSSTSSSTSSAGAPTATPTPPVTQGGTLNIGITQEPTSFLADGWVDSMTFAANVVAPVREALLQLRSTDETANAKTLADYYQPWLATKIPTTDNGLVKTSGCPNSAAKMCVTWPLQSGVTWHDGSTFSSHDVCATAQFAWLKYGLTGGKNPTGILSTTGFDQMLDCKEDTATQATIDFKSIYAPYLSLFSAGYQGVIPAKVLDAALSANSDLEKTNVTVDLSVGSKNTNAFKGTDNSDKMIDGTGPYVFQSYVPTKSITYVRNQNYWNKKHQPNLDKIVFQIVGDVQAQFTQVQAGQLDMGLDYRLAFFNQLNTLAAGGKVAYETIPESGAEKIDVNTCLTAHGLCGTDAKVPACCTSDPKFRHAMLEAINRQSIVDNIAAGKTVIPQDSMLYLGAEYAKSPDVKTTAYSTTQAQSDLDAAGYKISPSCHGGQGRADSNGKCVDLDFVTTSGNKARQQAQVAIQQDLQKVGIFTNISQVKAGKLFGTFSDGGVLYTHAFDLAMYTNTLSSPGEIDSFYPAYHADCGGTCAASNQIPSKANSGQGQDDTGEYNPTVDKDFDAGRSDLDLKARADAYKDAQTQLAKDLPELPLYQQVTVNSYTTKLQGLQRNDIVWLFNSYDWNCKGGSCQA